MLFRFQSNIYFYRQPKLVAFVVLTVLTVFNIYDNLRRVLLSYLSVFFQTIFFLRCCLINIHKSFADDVALAAVKASLCQFL